VSKLWWAVGAQALGSIIAFYQLQGHYAFPQYKKFFSSMWFLYLTSIPIAPLFFYATKWSYEHFGAFWNFRLAGFGIGTIVFGLMAWSIFGEVPTLKTIISLMLAMAIILIQVSNL